MQLSVRLDAELADRLDEMAVKMRRVNIGGVGSRVDALRAVIACGVTVFGHQLDAKVAELDKATAHGTAQSMQKRSKSR